MDRRLILVVVFLAIQIVLPVRYYAAKQDPFDERFAWRMFSEVRMLRCRPMYRQSGQPIALTARFHVAWINLARRGRGDVVAAMSKRLCDEAMGSPITLQLRCVRADASVVELSDPSVDQCAK